MLVNLIIIPPLDFRSDVDAKHKAGDSETPGLSPDMALKNFSLAIAYFVIRSDRSNHHLRIQRFRLLCNTVFLLPVSYHSFQL
ncbi:hypothetical protein [Nostoc sp. 'Peltigera membranacea cyanobiont' 213]|uniref:hypothetical protein n=1 Tax=Nostoc sp. 'Peltigera membranacea cyanobiont' 213 TaxID=2014530 RepID=UPI00117C3CD0|nr:hypothetical protein [Nostoc sp. 'Peltigera membranacea cyanobiont' 213]